MEVTEHLVQLSADYGGAQLLIDPHQAAHTSEVLRQHNIHVDQYEFTAPSNSALAQALCQAVRDHTISLPNDA